MWPEGRHWCGPSTRVIIVRVCGCFSLLFSAKFPSFLVLTLATFLADLSGKHHAAMSTMLTASYAMPTMLTNRCLLASPSPCIRQTPMLLHFSIAETFGASVITAALEQLRQDHALTAEFTKALRSRSPLLNVITSVAFMTVTMGPALPNPKPITRCSQVKGAAGKTSPCSSATFASDPLPHGQPISHTTSRK